MPHTKIKSAEEIEAMRRGGKILAGLLEYLTSQVKAGISTKELADKLSPLLKQNGVKSAFLGHEGFPESVCISVNEEVVHGIPSKTKIIKEGDVVTIDLGIICDGMLTDSARTVYVGDRPSADIARLMAGTEEALTAGIKAVRGETRVGDIASAIQTVLERNKLGIVRDLVGHGVGHSIHEEPNIPNYGIAGTGPILKPGMTVAIEPMATLGDWRVDILSDGWTVVTRDGSIAAQMEHTVLITESGAEILTRA